MAIYGQKTVSSYCSSCTQSNTTSHAVKRRMSLRGNVVYAYRMRVSKPTNLRAHARGHVTVFI